MCNYPLKVNKQQKSSRFFLFRFPFFFFFSLFLFQVLKGAISFIGEKKVVLHLPKSYSSKDKKVVFSIVVVTLRWLDQLKNYLLAYCVALIASGQRIVHIKPASCILRENSGRACLFPAKKNILAQSSRDFAQHLGQQRIQQRK